METAHDLYDRAEDAASYIRNHVDEVPQVGVILGSGLGEASSIVEKAACLDYNDIPNFPLPMTPGHKGELCVGPGPAGHQIAVLCGRIHLYEGYTVKSVTFPVRALQLLGVDTLIITNAAGGLDSSQQIGDLLCLTDQLNLTGEDPLTGESDPRLGPRFLDMSEPFDPGLTALAQEAAGQQDVRLHPGVYAGVKGPTFETRAEIERLRRMGADAVGMSTVNEVIAARHGQMRVLGLSVVTNVAGLRLEDVSAEVIAASQAASEAVKTLLAAIIARLDRD